MEKKTGTTDLKALTLATIGDLNDELAVTFDALLAGIAADCNERPGVTDKREINIKLSILPSEEDIEHVLVVPRISNKIPAREFEPVITTRTIENQLTLDF